MNPTPHLAVIGAGLAGLSRAAALQQEGLKVTVCERSRGVADRMSTGRGEDWQCDHVAQYFTSRHPDFRAEVERWVRAGVSGTWAPRLQEWSQTHLEQNANEIAARLLPAFCQLGGPTPQAWTAHRWRYADTELALDTGCAWEPDLGLGMCGDGLNGGKVEGAWLSGRALAQQVLQRFGAR